MDNELNIFRQMFTQMTEVEKPRRDEREWKIERRLQRRSLQRFKLGFREPYRKEYSQTIYKDLHR